MVWVRTQDGGMWRCGFDLVSRTAVIDADALALEQPTLIAACTDAECESLGSVSACYLLYCGGWWYCQFGCLRGRTTTPSG
eukprot:3301518-Amphidinium_carterae.1